ncbi:MAG: PQQ-binding-like beta-propeller repeat protein [Bryobacteraceae bacterium]
MRPENGRVPCCVALFFVFSIRSLCAQPVLTRSYNDARWGANTQETTLTPANVGGLQVLRVLTPDAGDDPRIEAQPLYVPQLAMSDGPHDTVIVCTMANNVYAFDVNSGAKLWKTNLGTPIKPVITGNTPNGQHSTDIDLFGINRLWGILSTPVIDNDTKTLYVVNWSSTDGTRAKAVHKLNALNVVNGQPVHTALVITGKDGAATFNSPDQKQRAALLLSPLTGATAKTCGQHIRDDRQWRMERLHRLCRELCAAAEQRRQAQGGGLVHAIPGQQPPEGGRQRIRLHRPGFGLGGSGFAGWHESAGGRGQGRRPLHIQ